VGHQQILAAIESNSLLMHLDSEVRKRGCRDLRRTSESVHQCPSRRSGIRLADKDMRQYKNRLRFPLSDRGMDQNEREALPSRLQIRKDECQSIEQRLEVQIEQACSRDVVVRRSTDDAGDAGVSRSFRDRCDPTLQARRSGNVRIFCGKSERLDLGECRTAVWRTHKAVLRAFGRGPQCSACGRTDRKASRGRSSRRSTSDRIGDAAKPQGDIPLQLISHMARSLAVCASRDAPQIPATEVQISVSLRLSASMRVSRGFSSSSSGSRRPTTLTRPPEIERATSAMESSASVAPAFGA
jgi:hypothetical protein